MDKGYAATVFPRDPRTGLQVWSGDFGYPGDAAYLDFHKKRWPGGHRYWRVTGAGVDMGGQSRLRPPRKPPARVRTHAEHFVHLVWEALANRASTTKSRPSCPHPSTPNSSAIGGSKGRFGSKP